MTQTALWKPTLFTPPISEDFPTDGDKLLKVIDLAWKSPESDNFTLDEWQRWLLRHVLERYPANHPKYPGQLRYRQVVISLGRQNGKSVLGAIFGLYGLLLHTQGPEVIGLAYTKEQADIIFKRVKFVIDGSPYLSRKFKSTNTRGLYSRDNLKPATYVMKGKAEDTLQGVTISLCLYDEVHLTKPETWDAVVFGTSARRDGMVLGITTAGDDKSELLLRLYKTGKAAVAREEGFDERFGFFLWEAPAHLDVTDPQALIAANPALASGRLDIDQEINAVRNMAEHKARRYRLNQFVASENPWLPVNLWNRLQSGPLPHNDNIVFGVDRSENWKYATITANVKNALKVHTKVIASIPAPTIDHLEAICYDLWTRFGGMGFVMEASVLKDLCTRLRERGVTSEYLTTTQMSNASQTVYSLIHDNRLVHGNDDLLRVQVPRGVSKNDSMGGWRISRRDSIGEVDSLLATVMGVYTAETKKPQGPMLWVA